ncbi:FAD-dependent oxidoreductase [Georgenia sp. MJ173]|uniref:FAD-dependent oxidoreductase n=1 Tax=Georgenia sunbinii TaxID=3117728 RepID=UPI002F268162
MTPHELHPSQGPWHDLPAGFADYLDLEARLSAPARSTALGRAALALDAAPSHIVDLGSGTGADAVALARRFPASRVHALDVSRELLDRVASAAVAAGVADQIEEHRVDLNDDWSSEIPTGVDLAWAALTLHHVGDPVAVLQQVFASLRPGGVFVLTELTGEARLTPVELGTGRAGLQDRITRALSHRPHTNANWSRLLADAGFDVVESHEHDFVARADTADGARYLEMQLRAQRERLVHEVTDDDLAALDAVIDALETGTSEISSSSGHTVWIAVRPQEALAGQTRQTIEHPDKAADTGGRAFGVLGSLEVDVVVVGGGSAGLAASVALARSRRKVVVIDAGQPRNAPAEGAHNVLGNEGIAPQDLLARGRAEAESYGVTILPGQVTRLSGTIDDFTVEVGDGSRRVHARRALLATGLVDDLPDVPGVEAGWGRTVLHCPFCHGWEVRDQRIAILTRDEVAIHHAMLFSQLSDQVTVFLHEAPDPTEEQWEQLAALNVSVVRPRVDRLVVEGAKVRAIQIDGGRTFEADAVVIAPRFNARTGLYEQLGGTAETTPFGKQIPTDPRGMTPVPGVWAAGNASEPMAMVVASTASGVATGSAVHGDLAFADLNQAVRARRAEHH